MKTSFPFGLGTEAQGAAQDHAHLCPQPARTLVPAQAAPSGAGRGREAGRREGERLHKVPRGVVLPACPSVCLQPGRRPFPPKLGQAVLKALARAWDPSLWDQRVRKAIPSWYQELCPALFWARSNIPGRWAFGPVATPSPRLSCPGGPSRGAPGGTGSSRVLGEDGMASRVRQEWQEILPGSGLGRTVPRSREDPGRALAGEWLVVTAKTSDANSGGAGTEGSLRFSTMGTVPSLSSWAIVLPEQAPAGQRPEPAAWGTVGPCRAMPGWTPGFLGASSSSGVPTGQAQLKGDVRSFQIRTTHALGRQVPTVAREGVGAGERLSQKRRQENQQLASAGTLPSLPGQRPRFCLRIQAASCKRPGKLLEGGRAAPWACPLPSPVHRAPEGLE